MPAAPRWWPSSRSEEHTSELQSLRHLVCRLLLEKKNNNNRAHELSIEFTHSILYSIQFNMALLLAVSHPRAHPGGARSAVRPAVFFFFFLIIGRPPRSPLFPSPPLSR